MKYILEMDEQQAELADKAFELYARLRMGQWRELAELCLNLKDDDYVEKREALRNALLQARKIAFPELSPSDGHSYGVGKFEDGDLAWEIHEVLRHRLAWTKNPEGGMGVNFDEPISFRGNPLAKCVVKSEEESTPCV